MSAPRDPEREDRINEEVSDLGRGWLYHHGSEYPTDEDRLDALYGVIERKNGTRWARSYVEGLDVSGFMVLRQSAAAP